MNTSRELSCILWNDVEFVKKKSDALVASGKFAFYFFVPHLPEEDEKKKHIHWYGVPEGRVDTRQLTEHFSQFDPNNPAKPIKPADWHFSKFIDAYLYFIHDSDYLLSKGESRVYSYTPDDIITSDPDELHEKYLRADKSKLKGRMVQKIIEAHHNNVSFKDLVASGSVPIQQISQYEKAYAILGGKTYRNGRIGHNVAINYEPGKSLDETLFEIYGIDTSQI